MPRDVSPSVMQRKSRDAGSPLRRKLIEGDKWGFQQG